MQGVQFQFFVEELKIPHASRAKNHNIKQKQYSKKFNKDFKNGPNPKKKKNLKKKKKQYDMFHKGYECED